MSMAIVLNQDYQTKEEVSLPESFSEIHPQNLYLYVKSYLAGTRANTAHTKTRAEVSGGGKKPWSQKGTGRARAGSITSSVFVGGGKAHGSTIRNYDQKINKKQVRLATLFALNQKANANAMFVVDKISVESGKTKDAQSIVNKLNQKDVLVIVENFDEKTYLAFRNLPKAYMIEMSELNPYWITAYSSVVIEKSVFDKIVKEG
ncbi:MAG: 50S ribosomal protein L4 [Campylobacterales bacterium]|nr:50S ribosomal protein L4 [Campylobacterales bacterium]